MKKMILAMSLVISSFAFSQYYQDTYPDYYGYEYYDNQYSYPDDYYYNYPTDYYPEDYYQNYYNDYRNSIVNINWNRFFRTYRLSPMQVQAIINLNNRFPSFMAWNSYYGMNPDRWYYDRFYELERILGPQVFVVYQQNYYRGLSPIVYFQNYRSSYYVVNYNIRPKYRNVDVIRYRVDRSNLNDSWKSTRNVAMIDTNASSIRSNSGTRNQSMISDNSNSNGIRNSSAIRNQASVSDNNGGTRTSSGTRNQSMIETSNSGIRNNVRNQASSSESYQTGGVRNNPVRSSEPVRSSSMEVRSNNMRSSSSNGATRSSGTRESQRDNAGGMRSSNSGTSRGR